MANNNVVINYGWQMCENGEVFHTLEATDPEVMTDADKMAGDLAKSLDTTADGNDFNWNSMLVRLPKTVVEKIKAEGVRECAEKYAKGIEKKDEEVKYIVRLIGSDVRKTIPCKNKTEAKKELRKAFKACKANNDGGDWFEDIEYDKAGGSFNIHAEEFYQEGVILPANNYTGLLHDVQEIEDLASAADAWASLYQHELQDLGTYDCTYDIRNLCGKLKEGLAVLATQKAEEPDAKKKQKEEKTYVDILDMLTQSILTDTAMPKDVRQKADLLVAQLQSALWPYSG